MFPVAGLGTRFLPATKSIPKEMLPIVDKPLIQYAVEEAIEAGIETLIFITSRKKHSIADHFDTAFELQTKLAASGKEEILARIREVVPDSVSRAYVTQPEALGLGHAILCAESVVGDEPFAVLLADDMVRNPGGAGCLAQMVAEYQSTGAGQIGVEEVPREKTSSYGIVSVETDQHGRQRINEMVEKPAPEVAPSRLGVVGRYVLPAAVFSELRQVGKGAGGEIQLTDGIAALLSSHPINAFAFEGERYDCGSREGFIRATIDFALDQPSLRESLLDRMATVIERERGGS